MNATVTFRGSDCKDKVFAFWSGRSGDRFVHSVFDPAAAPRYRDAVYLIVRRDGGHRRPVAIFVTGAFPDLQFLGRRSAAALRRGGNEVHVHVPAIEGMHPEAVACDIATEAGLVKRTGPGGAVWCRSPEGLQALSCDRV